MHGTAAHTICPRGTRFAQVGASPKATDGPKMRTAHVAHGSVPGTWYHTNTLHTHTITMKKKQQPDTILGEKTISPRKHVVVEAVVARRDMSHPSLHLDSPCLVLDPASDHQHGFLIDSPSPVLLKSKLHLSVGTHTRETQSPAVSACLGHVLLLSVFRSKKSWCAQVGSMDGRSRQLGQKLGLLHGCEGLGARRYSLQTSRRGVVVGGGTF